MVMLLRSAEILDTRPPLARPANSSSAISITLPGSGICPSKPTLNETVRVSFCSDFKAQWPAR